MKRVLLVMACMMPPRELVATLSKSSARLAALADHLHDTIECGGIGHLPVSGEPIDDPLV